MMNGEHYPIKVRQDRNLNYILSQIVGAILQNNDEKIRHIFNNIDPKQAVIFLSLLTRHQKKTVIKMLGINIDPRIVLMLDSKTKKMVMNILKRFHKQIGSDELTRDQKIQAIANNIISYLSGINNPSPITISKLVKDLAPADFASVLELLADNERMDCIHVLGDLFDPLTLIFLDTTIKELILSSGNNNFLEHCLISMSSEDIVELIGDLDKQQINTILNAAERVCKPQKIQAVYSKLRYDEDATGRIMRPGISISSRYSVYEIYSKLHHIDLSKKHAETIYVQDSIDNSQSLIGEIKTINIFRLANDKKYKYDSIVDHIRKIECVLKTDTLLKETGFLFKEYSSECMPVVNASTNKFMGVVQANQAIDIISQEETSLSLVGMQESDFYVSTWDSVKIRINWMFLSSIATMLSVFVIHIFEDVISKNVIMAVIMPIVPAIGGSAVSQVFTVTIRAIANQEINEINLRRSLGKELVSGLVLGIFIGITLFVMVLLVTHNLNIALTILFPMIINTIWAGFIGTIAPLLLNKYGFDAAAASIFLNASTDIVGYSSIFIAGKYFLSL